MNDARMSGDFVASERARDREAFRAAARDRAAEGRALGRPRGALTAEAAAARRELLKGRDEALEEASTTHVAVPAAHQPTAEQAMGTVRLSLAAVLVLVLVFVWIRQRSA